jgi:D-alanine--poly(phosphoribitol) ligase subunit 2
MKEKIIEIIENAIISDVDVATCQDLVDGGYLDSLEIVSIVMDLNEEFGVNISAVHLLPENFNSVDAIAELINSL